MADCSADARFLTAVLRAAHQVSALAACRASVQAAALRDNSRLDAVPCIPRAVSLVAVLRDPHGPASASVQDSAHAREWAEHQGSFRLRARLHARSVRAVHRAVAVRHTKRAKKAQ
jgi:hypothetical protein